jgi:hypothetical protein
MAKKSKIELSADLSALDDINLALAAMQNAEGNKLVRQGLVKAARPMRRQLKKDIRLLRDSPLSTGATERSISEMVRYPGSKRNMGGFKIGVALQYSETHFKTNEYLHRKSTKAKNRRKLTGIVNYGRKTGKKRHTQKYVRAFKKISHRRKGLSRPGKYWHLIHQGFKHYQTGKRFPGYRFVPKVNASTGKLAKQIFTDEVLKPLRKQGRKRRPSK